MDIKETPLPKSEIPKPEFKDSKKFDDWLSKIKRPLVSFETAKHPNGKIFTREEQLQATRKQLKETAEFLKKAEQPDEEIETVLVQTAEEERLFNEEERAA